MEEQEDGDERGVKLLIREVWAYSAIRVNYDLSEGWMEMDGEWDISDKRFVELVLLKKIK